MKDTEKIVTDSATPKATRTRKVTVNKCGYIVIKSTSSYPRSKIKTINGSSPGSFGLRAYTSQVKPSCRKGNSSTGGSYVYQGWQGTNFIRGNDIYIKMYHAAGTKIEVIYQ